MVPRDEYRDLKHALQEIFPDAAVKLSPSESRGHVPAAQADVCLASSDLRLRVELLHASSRAKLVDAVELARLSPANGDPSIPVVASPYFSPSSQQLLRDANAAFIDYAGNAWLVAPGIHVDRRGFANPGREERGQRDLFSDKASLILRALFATNSPIGVRQIAALVSSKDEGIGLTPGYVSKVAKELERRGYAARHDEKIVLRHADELLRDWLVAYRGRRRPTPQSYFIPAPSAEDLMPSIAASFDAKVVDYVFTGHAGASLVDRHAFFDVVDVYVKNLDDVAQILSGLSARRVERGGNVDVSVPYYRESAFYDYQMPKGRMKVASDLQLYLDLYDYPVRGREQAEHLYDRRLRSLVERDDRL